MISISGYKINEELYVSGKAAIYRGVRTSDNTQVVVKLQLSEYPTEEEIANFKHEFNLLGKLNLKNIIKVYALEKVQHRYAMVMEDVPDAITLKDFIDNKPIELEMFFKIAEGVCAALHEIHSQGIIHKDINPNNIILTPDATTIKIIDFNIASELAQETQELKSAESLEGTLSYISPEQTSRLNRSVDHRTDLYSLGVTFYQMLTGKLPFQAKDAVEWVHSHIAKQPKPLETVNADIPKQLSLIVLRLLSKNPEDRYNTAFGLLSDLKHARTSWLRKRAIEEFPLAENDRSSLFQIPQKLYGRVVEVEQLISAYQRIARGGRNVLLVYGYSGVGKSSLVNEIHKPVVKQRGYFASGKFEQFQTSTPYFALIQALRSLIRQIISTGKEPSQHWADAINNAVAPNGKLIVDVIPELATLIGEQPPVPSLPPSETKSRFELVFFDFVSVFGKADHPTVLFLDDVQWVDVASLKILKQFLFDETFEYILIIMSYRDNEVQEGHPFLGLISELQQREVPIERLEVKPLDLANVKKLVQDTLHTQVDIEPLADLVMEKTGGNPFFVNSTLKMFHDEKLIHFDIDQGEWVWEMAKLQSVEIAENVVDLVVKKINKLDADTQEALKVAACIGNKFELGILAYVIDKPVSSVASLLWPTLEAQLIIPLSQDYKLAMADDEYKLAKNTKYKFSHDRIQQAAMSLFEDDELALINIKLARILLDNTDETELENKLFEIVNHFNANLDLITDKEEKRKVADLNLRAGNKAKDSVAYDTATQYFQAVLTLLGDAAWDENYDLVFKTKLAHTECVHLAGNFEQADKMFAELIEKAKTAYDKARVLSLQALSYAIQIKRPESIKAGLGGANALGFKVKAFPSIIQVSIETLKTMWAFRGKKADTLLDIKNIENEEKILLMDILERVTSTAYLDDRNLMVVIALRALRYILKEGYSSSVTAHYVVYALIWIGGFKNYARGYDFAYLADQISQRFEDSRMRTQTIFMINILIYPWRKPYRECFRNLSNAYDLGRQSGELIYSCYAAALMPVMMMMMGARLNDVISKWSYVAPLPEHVGNVDSLVSTHTLGHMLPVIRGDKAISHFHERLTELFEDNIPYVHPVAIGTTGVLCLLTAYLLEDWENVEKLIEFTRPYATSDYMEPLFVVPEFHLISSLYYLLHYPTFSFRKRRKAKKYIKKSLKLYKLWSKSCRENFNAKYELLLGGMDQLTGKTDSAFLHFEKCLDEARTNDLILVEALSNEFVGKSLLRQGLKKSAKLFMQEALLLYNHWGSNYKVKYLQKQFPGLILQARASKRGDFMTTTMTHTDTITTRTSTSAGDSGLDMLSIMKSTQALSGEVDWEKLVHSLIEIAIENAGASRGILILDQNDTLTVVAKCDSPDEESEILQNTTVDAYGELCISLVNYVKSSQIAVTLDNAAEQGEYVEDPYVLEKKPLSIVAIPIVHKGEFKGVLYLENNLTTNAFPDTRLEVLKAFAAQAAISIENSQLYTAYSQFVPHEFLDLLKKKRIIDVQIGDNIEMNMSILFCDIRKFTTLSEKLTPEENFQFINEYMRYMEPNIRQQGGFIDKFIGDAIMALYPQNSSDGAILSAISMQISLKKYNEIRQERNEPPIFIGLGINFGTLVLGTVGAQARMDTTVIGDTVNAASRLEGLTKTYATPILISQSAYDALQSPDLFNLRFVDRVQVRGKEAYVNVWEVFSEEWDPNCATKKAISGHYQSAVRMLLNQQYKEALAMFQRCYDQMPTDSVLTFQIERCEGILRGDIPPLDRADVTAATETPAPAAPVPAPAAAAAPAPTVAPVTVPAPATTVVPEVIPAAAPATVSATAAVTTPAPVPVAEVAITPPATAPVQQSQPMPQPEVVPVAEPQSIPAIPPPQPEPATQQPAPVQPIPPQPQYPRTAPPSVPVTPDAQPQVPNAALQVEQPQPEPQAPMPQQYPQTVPPPPMPQQDPQPEPQAPMPQQYPQVVPQPPMPQQDPQSEPQPPMPQHYPQVVPQPPMPQHYPQPAPQAPMPQHYPQPAPQQPMGQQPAPPPTVPSQGPALQPGAYPNPYLPGDKQ